MAKLTGQFTTPSLDSNNNKTHKPFLHGVVFVFTGATKVTRETDAKGKYSFDLANGEYEVSVYLKGNTEKDRFDMRAGEKFTVTATTQADALEKWLQVIGTSGKDELATYYENLLTQMQKVANDFKKDTEFVGTGKIVRDSVTSSKADKFNRYLRDEHINSANEEGSYSVASRLYVTPLNGYPENLSAVGVINVYRYGSETLIQIIKTGSSIFSRVYNLTNPGDVVWHKVGSKDFMSGGDFGLGGIGADIGSSGVEIYQPNGFYRVGGSAAGFPDWKRSGDSAIRSSWSGLYNSTILFGQTFKRYAIHTTSNGIDKGWSELYTTSNTTIDSNGFIKAASPIIKLFNDRIEHSGFGANKPVFEKLGVGQYKISNTLGLAQEGWTYEKPRGNDGQPYFRIVVEKLEDGCIVRVHDEYDTVEKAEITDINGNTRAVDKIVKILGQARDIKEHERWIDLRFHEEEQEYQEAEE